MSLLSPSLEAFLAVVETTTVQGASRSLGLTQTGVTQRIRTLEKQLGVTLFLRSRKGMRLTPEGEALRRYCESARELEGRTLAELKGREAVSTVELGISGPSSLMRARVIPRCVPVLKKYPRLRLTFDVADGDGTVDKIKRGVSQIGLMPPEQVVLEMDSRMLKPERYILAGPAAWKKRELDEILREEVIVDFSAADTMTFDFLEKYRWLAKCRKERCFANNTDALGSLIKAGAAYSVLSEEFGAADLKRGDLIDLAPGKFTEHKIALAWYPRAEMPSYFKDLIEAISTGEEK